MNKEVIKRWIKALRSGDYEQTRDHLKFKEAFCVTGVLCDLHSKEFNIKWQEIEKDCSTYINEPYSPPDKVYDWSGINTTQLQRVMAWNDIDRLSFNEIAAKLEEWNNE